MALYSWNPACMGGVFALPNEVADRLLAVASAEQMRVLLWFSRHGGWDPAACAADLKMDAAECEGCLRFWNEQGILTAAIPQPVADQFLALRSLAEGKTTLQVFFKSHL